MTDTTPVRPRTPAPIAADQTLGDLVTSHPSLARVLERRGLDYCCGGGRTLAAACDAAGLDVGEVAGELAAESSDDDVVPEWAAMGVVQLVDHLEATHHRYLWDELPRVAALADKVRQAHGERHPEVVDVERLAKAIRADLEPHLRKEEQVLFPMIRELAVADVAPRFHCGSLRNPITVMLVEHDQVGELFAELRAVTGDYLAPADGCASYRALYDALAGMEADTHLHIHKENNVLFPAVERLERRLGGC